MSKYEAELLRRLASGEDVEKTAMWFMECVIKRNLDWKDLSVFEVRFMKRIHEGYTRWMANRKLH
jgi:hypothetical protein